MFFCIIMQQIFIFVSSIVIERLAVGIETLIFLGFILSLSYKILVFTVMPRRPVWRLHPQRFRKPLRVQCSSIDNPEAVPETPTNPEISACQTTISSSELPGRSCVKQVFFF
jgi:hypothetical protein